MDWVGASKAGKLSIGDVQPLPNIRKSRINQMRITDRD